MNFQFGITSFIAVIVVLQAGFILTTACEPFEPLEENKQHFFSVNGFLDASSDTQWVRVMPVRESLDMEPDLPAPKVTLHHPESGESEEMKDSLFTFRGNRYTYLYWTNMEVHPEETYRINITGQNGRTSRAEATLPSDFPDPEFLRPEFGADILSIQRVKKLAEVRVTYRLRFNDSGEIFNWVFPQLQYSTFHPPDKYRATIDAGKMRVKIIESYCGFTVTDRTVFVAAGGPDWPDFVSLGKYAVTLPDGTTNNIENGVGFFGGIISKTFSYIDFTGNRGLFETPC